MNRKNLWVVVLLWVACVVAGCVADDMDYGEMEQNAISVNGISVNGISVNGISVNGISVNGISVNGISVNGTYLPQQAIHDLAESSIGSGADNLMASDASLALVAQEQGRNLFAYIVSCALPEASTIAANVSGTQYQFSGGLGLAPDWAERGLTESERRWVTACLLARSNAYGMHVQVSLRGNEALTPTPEEHAEYTVLEGGFYGNIFVDQPNKIEMVACRGRDQAAGEWGGLVNRDCAEPGANGLTTCGMKYAGDCLDYTPADPGLRACAASIDGNYTDCNRNASAVARPGRGTREVVTVYVKN